MKGNIFFCSFCRLIQYLLLILCSLSVPSVFAQTLSGNGDFGSVEVGQTINRTFTFTASPTNPTAITNISVTGADFFEVSNTCPSLLSENTSCSITVGYEPSEVGADNGTLDVLFDNCTGSCAPINLSGNGVLPSNPTVNITSPSGDLTITEGESVNFTGSAGTTSICVPAQFFWNFDGGARNRQIEDPGAVVLSPAGTYNVRFTVIYETPEESPAGCPVNALSDSVTITVEPLNNPPDAVDDNAITNSNTAINITVLANDSDPDGDPISILNITQPANGSAQIVGNQIQYDPQGFAGTTSFTYTISDGELTDTATVSVTVEQANRPPEANPDNVTTLSDQSIDINVLANDSDPDGDPISILNITQPANGSAQIVGNQIQYDPQGFAGTTSFTYTISDGELTDTATVIVNIDQANRAPNAVDDNAVTDSNTPITINVLSNDSDPDGNPIFIQSVSSLSDGSGTLEIADNQILYDPQGFVGTTSFTYIISDGELNDSAIVTIVSQQGNRPPVANPDNVITQSDQPVLINVLANDTDPDGDTIILQSISQTPNGQGTVQIVGNQIQYDPQGFAGSTTFSYIISDGQLTDTTTVTVNISQANRPPNAVDDNVTTTTDQPISIDVLANDSDPDGNEIFIQSIINPPVSQGTVVLEGGQIVFTPTEFVGFVQFNYIISDGALTDTAEVRIQVNATIPTNNPPNAIDDAISLDQNSSITFDPRINDFDPDGDPLTIILLTEPSNGSASTDGSSITYTPDPGFQGLDQLTYQIADNRGGTATASVNITVNEITTPTPIDQISLNSSGSAAEGQTLTITVIRTALIRATNQPLTISYRTLPGTAIDEGNDRDYDPVTGELSWAANETGERSVEINILSDNQAEDTETFNFELFNIPDDVSIEGSSRITLSITDVTQNFSDNENLNDNQRDLAEALDILCPATTSQALQQQCEALEQLSDSELPGALDQIMPDELAGLQTASINGVHFFIDLLERRTVSLRRGQRGFDMSGVSLSLGDQNLPVGKLAHSFGQELTGGSAGGEVFSSQFERLGVFLSGRIVFGEQDETEREPGYEFDTLGLLAGADYRVSDQLIMGGALGYLNTDSDFNGNKAVLDTTIWTAALYGTYYFNEQWYVDGAIQYGRGDYDLRRDITFGSNDTFTTGSTDGDQFGISVTAGGDFYRNAWLLSPYLGLDYATASLDRFSESGGDGLALNIVSQDVDNLTSRLGVRVSRSYSMSWGIFSPTAFVEWAHEFKDDSRDISATFVVDPSAGFTIQTDEPDRNYFNLGIGAAATFTQGRSGFINYEGRFGDSDFESHRIQAGIRMEF